MRLTILGSAGSFPSADSTASGYLVQADDADGRTWSVLLDLGNGALGALQRYGDPTALDAIGLSHLHADHVADLAVLHVLRRYDPAGALPPVPRVGPVGTAERLVQLCGSRGPERAVHGRGVGGDCRGVVGPLTLTPVPVEHPIPAFGSAGHRPERRGRGPHRDPVLQRRHRRVPRPGGAGRGRRPAPRRGGIRRGP